MTTEASNSENISDLALALSLAQGALTGAKKGSDNPFFKSKYADLSAVIGSIREPFSAQGLSYVQIPGSDPEGYFVDTLLMHKSGQWIKGRIRMNPVQDNPQGIGSVITYMRRYALQAMAGLEAEDDDGNNASGNDGRKNLPVQKPLKEGTYQKVPDASTSNNLGEKHRAGEAESARSAVSTTASPTISSWHDVVCHIGKAGGPLKDKPLGKLATSSLEWLETQMAKATKPTKQDLILTAALAMWRGATKASAEGGINRDVHAGTPNRDMLEGKCRALNIPGNVVDTVSRTLGGAAKSFDEIPDDEAKYMLGNWEETANLIKDEIDNLK